jgi:hypothetical protein
MRVLVSKSQNNLPQVGQALVDVLCLLQSLPYGTRLGQPLRASKVNKIQGPYRVQ